MWNKKHSAKDVSQTEYKWLSCHSRYYSGRAGVENKRPKCQKKGILKGRKKEKRYRSNLSTNKGLGSRYMGYTRLNCIQ